MKPEIERRRHPRFELKNDALVVLKPHPIKLGQIINISEGGISFHYLSHQQLPLRYFELDIFISGPDNHYNAFPFLKVNDFKLSGHFEKVTPTRQLCIKFDSLSNEQKKQLKAFINNHTI